MRLLNHLNFKIVRVPLFSLMLACLVEVLLNPNVYQFTYYSEVLSFKDMSAQQPPASVLTKSFVINDLYLEMHPEDTIT